MPIYEYRCPGCGTRFEELVSASSPPPPCPDCGAAGATRLYSMFATEWIPSNVAWHRMPNRHDLGGDADSRPMASIPKAIDGGKGKKGKPSKP